MLPAKAPLCRLAALAAFIAACARPPDSMTIALPQNLATLDPHAQDAVVNATVLFHAYEGLVMTDPELKIQPAIAVRWENPDPTTWIFRLRPGVVFHDGRPLRAADVVYSLRRAQTADLEMKTYLIGVTSVRALDEATVEVRTASPDRILLRKLAFVVIVPEGALRQTLETSPNGTGTYALVEWRKERSLRLGRNERYWGPRPELREVEFHFNVALDDAIASLRSGEYRLIQGPSKQMRSALGSGTRHEIRQTDSLYVVFVNYDLSREKTPYSEAERNPFKDPRVRRALDLAIDRPRLVGRLASDARPASQLVPPAVFGFNPRIPAPRPDPVAARALLAEAGFGRGFAVVLHARPLVQDAALALKEQLQEVGIQIEIRLLSGPEYFDAVHRRELSLWLSSVGCSTGDASEILNSVVHSSDKDHHWGQWNFGGYANAEQDAAIEAVAGIDDPIARRTALERIMATVMDERVLLPLFVTQDAYAIDRRFSWRPRSDSLIRATEIRAAR